ncbi:MAG: dehydrogenase, partial [Planctomycetes bacterium]|nr:dehydrogenase [Planctomycetota bacterium]
MTRLPVFLALLTASAGDLPPCAAQEVSFRDVLSEIAPKTPEESLECLQVWDGFQVELVCAEPMVRDPIALDWGPDGKLWVVEMGDYPRGEIVGVSGGGRIKCLVDANGDGKPDRATVFLDGLAYPTGVMAWGRGVLITCAPRILYAEDTDGDGQADRRDVLFEGFSQGNPQHQVNGLRWGVDNWIYGANGDNGGLVTSTKTGERLDIHARDFRIRPETGEIQTQTGMSQFGRCRDDWGNWFGGRNLEPIWHCALDDQYLRRNPYLVPPNPCVSLLDPPTCARVYPISEMLPRFNEPWTMNRFTASCGNAVYRDSLFGPAFANSFFVCEPAYNLVYCGVLHPHGVTFSGQRHADWPEREFLASRDHWFRPTQVRTGPDGALWVVDMYRLVIEHPDFIPAKWHDQLDFRAGADKGRIYRVFPSGTRPRMFTPLHDLTTARLVESLDDPNGPRRDMVQQLLVGRRDKSAVAPLSQLVSDSGSPKCRLSALCTLDGLGSVPVPVLVRALADPHAAVRRQAIRIAEPMMDGSSAIQAAVLSLWDDADPQVRMQLAYSLGQWNDRRAGEALAALALRDADEPFLIAAIMSSATLYPGEILERMIAEREVNAAQAAMIENLVRLVFESGQEDVLARALARIATEGGEQPQSWRYQVLAGFLDVLEYRGSSLSQWHQQGAPETRAASQAMDRMIAAARRAAFDEEVPPTVRVPAVRLVGRGLQRSPDDVTLLSSLLVPRTAVELQHAAVDALRA